MKCMFIHFTIQIMPNCGKERDPFYFQFCFETKKILKQILNQEIKQETHSKLIFWKQSNGIESLFLKEKQLTFNMHMQSIFSFFL